MYIQTQTNTYPVSLNAIRSAFPSTLFPNAPTDAQLEPFNYANVFSSAQPDFNPDIQQIRELTPIHDGSQYNQVWEVFDLSTEEIDGNLENARVKRKGEINQDWSDNTDAFYAHVVVEQKVSVKTHLSDNYAKLVRADPSSTDPLLTEIDDITQYNDDYDAEAQDAFSAMDAITQDVNGGDPFNEIRNYSIPDITPPATPAVTAKVAGMVGYKRK